MSSVIAIVFITFMGQSCAQHLNNIKLAETIQNVPHNALPNSKHLAAKPKPIDQPPQWNSRTSVVARSISWKDLGQNLGGLINPDSSLRIDPEAPEGKIWSQAAIDWRDKVTGKDTGGSFPIRLENSKDSYEYSNEMDDEGPQIANFPILLLFLASQVIQSTSEKGATYFAALPEWTTKAAAEAKSLAESARVTAEQVGPAGGLKQVWEQAAAAWEEADFEKAAAAGAWSEAAASAAAVAASKTAVAVRTTAEEVAAATGFALPNEEELTAEELAEGAWEAEAEAPPEGTLAGDWVAAADGWAEAASSLLAAEDDIGRALRAGKFNYFLSTRTSSNVINCPVTTLIGISVGSGVTLAVLRFRHSPSTAPS